MFHLPDDTLAVILVSTSLGLPRDGADVAKPLTLKEWNALAKKLAGASRRPASLLDSGVAATLCDLGLPELSERVAALIARAPQTAIAVERLTSTGIWVLGRSDPSYPPRLRHVLKQRAPAVLFGAGPRELLESQGLAVVGSRGATADDLSFAARLAQAATASRLTVVSGAAKGTDRTAMQAAIDAGGRAVGVLADSLTAAIRSSVWRRAIGDQRLTLVTPYVPDASFAIWRAMDRNRVVYALAKHAVVVAASDESGGTWSGAEENLRQQWVPMFVRDHPNAPDGNQALIRRGAIPLTDDRLTTGDDVANVLDSLVESRRGHIAVQASFGNGSDAIPTRAEKSAAVLDSVSVMHGQAAPSDTSAPLPPSAEHDSAAPYSLDAQATDGGVDLYHVVWPHIAAFLNCGRTREEIRQHFKLESGQAKKWLERAQSDDRVTASGSGSRRQYRSVNLRAVQLI